MQRVIYTLVHRTKAFKHSAGKNPDAEITSACSEKKKNGRRKGNVHNSYFYQRLKISHKHIHSKINTHTEHFVNKKTPKGKKQHK